MIASARSAIAVSVLALPVSTHAHHSWGAVYNGGEEVTIDATIAGDVSRNPHLTVQIEIAGESGQPEQWTLEWRGGRRRDGEAQITYDLSRGDAVVIEGRIARFPRSKKMQMFALMRPADGMRIEARRLR